MYTYICECCNREFKTTIEQKHILKFCSEECSDTWSDEEMMYCDYF